MPTLSAFWGKVISIDYNFPDCESVYPSQS